jgi:sugar phosphate isomerase/epimerase
MPLKYSVTSVMLPHLDLDRTGALLRANGCHGLELRVRTYAGEAGASPSPWGRHVTDVSPENVSARAAEIRGVLARHGLALAAFASNASALELDVVRRLAEGAAAVGCPLVRVGAPRAYRGDVPYAELFDEAVRAYEQVIPITRANGVRCLIEIHGGTIFVSASLAHRLLSRFDPKDIGVIYDPQNMAADGYETTSLALDLLGDYLAHVHIGGHRCAPGTPDAAGTVPWTYPACRLEEGRYNYPQLMAELTRRSYRGFISLEDFDTTRTPEQRVADALSYLRRIEPAA